MITTRGYCISVKRKQDDEVIQYTSEVSDIIESQYQLYYRSDIDFQDGGLRPRPRVCGVAVHCMHSTIKLTLKNCTEVVKCQVTH